MKRKLSFVVLLAIYWLSLSGHFSPLLLALGAASIALVTVLSLRMGVVDRDGHPAQLAPRIPLYFIWLIKEISLASIAVLRMVINGKYRPAVGRIKTKQTTQLGVATLANSITLTPGTMSLRLLGDEIEVHSLDRALLEDLQNGDMPDRVYAFDRPYEPQEHLDA